ncbi:MAG: thiamine ABC transporter substrate-binding protein [Actinobacteria bacterium]|nr:thiamine ABC transporter substrate-binding protein [Actinomycetota bacterium]
MRRRAPLVALLLTTLLTACSDGAEEGGTVTLVTHDSFAVSKPVLRAFERETGIHVKVLKSGDAGEVLNQVILTKGAPLGDVVFGVDNTFLSRALAEQVFVPYRAKGLDRVPAALRLDPRHRATPIDWGDVCVNYDVAWYSERGLEPPTNLVDLLDPRYRGQLVVENPATSSPGLAFFLATIASEGSDGWESYWSRLRANDVLVVDGWEQAYNTEFSASAGDGPRPLVVSYATSPAAEVMFAEPPVDVAPTGNVEATCFRQVEHAGILADAKHPVEARRFLDFLLSERFQADVPASMFVYPAREGTPLPEEFVRYAAPPTTSLTLPPTAIAAKRDEWIERWTELTLR